MEMYCPLCQCVTYHKYLGNKSKKDSGEIISIRHKYQCGECDNVIIEHETQHGATFATKNGVVLHKHGRHLGI